MASLCCLSGADPGIFVRGGGSNFQKNWRAKKKKEERKLKKTEGCGGSFPSAAKVWFESTFQTIIYIKVYCWEGE